MYIIRLVSHNEEEGKETKTVFKELFSSYAMLFGTSWYIANLKCTVINNNVCLLRVTGTSSPMAL